ncbi:hypothetical protein QR680_002095 [Steinernema hermaphroditum]|uniref:Prominin-like protein n=1 Tax=Steinernema hermaphroditum TaxID=289476 RepID=A0AA39LHK3_9BILA|nr:hypothetical protein QR680_002095 [Steinernema hermaphroditum]
MMFTTVLLLSVTSAMVIPLLDAHQNIKFDPFPQIDEYKCTRFLQNAMEDKAMEHYYSFTNQVISALSKPFPHRELISQRMIEGDLEAWKESITVKYYKWLDYFQWWIVFGGSFIVVCCLFSLGYFLYRCCVLCCRKRTKETTDHEYDRCKRNCLNTLLSLLVVANVFAGTALFISTQYMEYGAEELPQRVNNCIDDLNLYKRNTDEQVKKLLITDYQKLNHSLLTSFGRSGELIVEKIKEITGASAVDQLLLVAKNASEVLATMKEADVLLRQTNDEMTRFKNEFSRMKKTSSEELLECVKAEIDPKKQQLCQRTAQMLEALDSFKGLIELELNEFQNSEDLRTLINANISYRFQNALDQFKGFSDDIQQHINSRLSHITNEIKQIGDGLFQVAEAISKQIRQVYLDGLYDAVNKFTEKGSRFSQYVEYSWYGSLILSGLFVFISLTFLLGLFYGCCGRRPTYYNDDCCVRSTGSKFFSCGMFVSVFLMFFLSLITITIMFIGGNTANLVCHPLNNPLLRPDSLSLAERVVDTLNLNRFNKTEGGFDISKIKVADIIQGCDGNETFYSMLNLDAKHHLTNIIQQYDYNSLKQYLYSLLSTFKTTITVTMAIGPEHLKILESLSQVNLSATTDQSITMIETEITSLELLPKADTLREDLQSFQESPKAVDSVLSNLSSLESNYSRSIRDNLEKLLSLLRKSRAQQRDMNIPFADLPVKLQHAQALLKNEFQDFLRNASIEITDDYQKDIDGYIKHVSRAIRTDVTSCEPIKQIGHGVRSALCASTVDPLNGIWMSMLLSLLLTMLIIVLSTPLVQLYKRMHSYPKYTVHEPLGDQQMNAFATDTYDTRVKHRVYSSGNYGNYNDIYPPPYLGARLRS